MNLAKQSSGATSWLSRFVEDVRVLGPGAPRHVDWLPDGCTSLVFRAMAGGRRGDVSIAGPRTHAFFKTASGVARVVMLQFRPGWAAPLLGVGAQELTDRIVNLQDVWGRAGADLCDELLATGSASEAVERISSAIAQRSDHHVEPASAALARRAVRMLAEGEARVETVADRLGVTARHLRRAFTENVGIGPKDFARAVRLQRAVRMTASAKDWSRIAADAGYYDQAHLIADFRELVGLTPGAFRKHVTGERTFTSAPHAPP